MRTRLLHDGQKANWEIRPPLWRISKAFESRFVLFVFCLLVFFGFFWKKHGGGDKIKVLGLTSDLDANPGTVTSSVALNVS